METAGLPLFAELPTREQRAIRRNQRGQILDLLRSRGKAGASTGDLMKIGERFGARIHELRTEEGYDISEEAEGANSSLYILVGHDPAKARGRRARVAKIDFEARAALLTNLLVELRQRVPMDPYWQERIDTTLKF